jgi:hypothetical protein
MKGKQRREGMVDGRLPVTKMRNRPVDQQVGRYCTLYGFRGLLGQVKIKTFCISDVIVHMEYDGDDVKFLKVTVPKDGPWLLRTFRHVESTI